MGITLNRNMIIHIFALQLRIISKFVYYSGLLLVHQSLQYQKKIMLNQWWYFGPRNALRLLHTVPTRFSSKRYITIIARSSPNVSVDSTISLTHTNNIKCYRICLNIANYSELIMAKVILVFLPYLRISQSSGTRQYLPVASTVPNEGILLGLPSSLHHRKTAN